MMPSRINQDGTRTRVSSEEAAAAGQGHMDALGRAGVTWEDLGDRHTMHEKIERYNQRTGEDLGCACSDCR